MSSKMVWITSLGEDEMRAQLVMAQTRQYGLVTEGHFWDDNLEKMAWLGAREPLIRDAVSAWVIVSSAKEMGKASVRYGLSALALTVKAVKGSRFPILLLSPAEEAEPPALPTPLQGVVAVSEAAPWTAKLVAAVNRSRKEDTSEYRIDLHGNDKLGQWFEVGPVAGVWKGMIFGTAGGEIDFQAVGPRGGLPETSTIEYGQKDMKLSLNDTEHTAWALQNEIDTESSYYVRVKGSPESILFCEYAQDDSAEVFFLALS